MWKEERREGKQKYTNGSKDQEGSKEEKKQEEKREPGCALLLAGTTEPITSPS